MLHSAYLRNVEEGSLPWTDLTVQFMEQYVQCSKLLTNLDPYCELPVLSEAAETKYSTGR